MPLVSRVKDDVDPGVKPVKFSPLPAGCGSSAGGAHPAPWVHVGAGPLPPYCDGVAMKPPSLLVLLEGNGRLYAALACAPSAPVTVVEYVVYWACVLPCTGMVVQLLVVKLTDELSDVPWLVLPPLLLVVDVLCP